MDQAMPQEKLNEEMKKLCDRKLTGSIRHQLHTTLSLSPSHSMKCIGVNIVV